MGPIGLNWSLWTLMGPYVSLWFSKRYLWVFMGLYAYLCVFMCPFRLLCVLMGPFGSLKISMRPYGSFLVFKVLMRPYRFLWSSCVFIDSNGSLCVHIGLFAFLWI